MHESTRLLKLFEGHAMTVGAHDIELEKPLAREKLRLLVYASSAPALSQFYDLEGEYASVEMTTREARELAVALLRAAASLDIALETETRKD